jgi:hypothetical protein
LSPSARVEHNETLSTSGVDCGVIIQDFDPVFRIDKVERGRGWVTIDNAHFFSELSQYACHTHFASESVAIGPNVAGQDKALARMDSLGQLLPIYRHLFSTYFSEI